MSRYGVKRASRGGIVHMLTMLNLALCAGILLAWSTYADALADPLSVMAGTGVAARPGVFEYPYILLWLVPLTGVAGTYVARFMELPALARFFAVYPGLLTLTCCTWLYFFAGYWG